MIERLKKIVLKCDQCSGDVYETIGDLAQAVCEHIEAVPPVNAEPVNLYRKHFLRLLQTLESTARHERERADAINIDDPNQWEAGYRYGEAFRAEAALKHAQHYLKLAERGME